MCGKYIFTFFTKKAIKYSKIELDRYSILMKSVKVHNEEVSKVLDKGLSAFYRINNSLNFKNIELIEAFFTV